jgi:hypothetical protein
MIRLLIWILILAWTFGQPVLAAPERIPALSLPSLKGWEENSFVGHTHYEVVQNDGQYALKATSDKSASGYVRKMKVDLTKTPYLHWSWKAENILHNVDERTKSGDDYPARIYVVISGGLFFWRTRALNYVWSSNQSANSHWVNAFTSNAICIAQESGATHLGEWITEKRNILADIKRYLNMDATHIDAVAIMTDTDNSGQSATAYYRDIYFSSE